ncbi:MAG: carbonic anhydrase [Chlamydiales bacterium]|nr:carbonic anhydrase [Chlamydiales bacterium]
MRYLLLLLLCTAVYASPIDKLMEGNHRFMNENIKCIDRDTERRENTAFVQKPFAIVLTCADSRVAPEIVFDQGIGDLFVVRVAGNVVTPAVLESIDYSAVALNSSLIVVMGHQRCGAVAAVMDHHTELIPHLAMRIDPATKMFPRNLEKAVKQNARIQRDLLLKAPHISKLVEKGELEVVAAYYDFDTGQVVVLDRKEASTSSQG